jgi:hypothetical protein
MMDASHSQRTTMPNSLMDRRHASLVSLGAAALLVMVLAGCQTAPPPREPGEDAAEQQQPQEPAADEQPPLIPQPGLILWLYPSAEQLVVSGGEVVQWLDASSRKNDLESPGQSPRPQLIEGAIADQPAVQFDGVDDILMRDGFAPDEVAAATVFLVVAPSQSSGLFDGLVSAGTRGNEDSWTGFNIDLGGKSHADCSDIYRDELDAFNTINVQSAKTDSDCGGDLLESSLPFGEFAVVTVSIERVQTLLRLNGADERSAAGGDQTLSLPQFRLGVRYHRRKFQGFYNGAIAEVIVYNRSLSGPEIVQVESYLSRQYRIDLAYEVDQE